MTLENLKDHKPDPCEDCIFKKGWKNIGELLSDVLKKQAEQEPTAHWIYTGDYITEGMLKCSKCGFEHDVSERFCYCPNCGEQMKTEAENDS